MVNLFVILSTAQQYTFFALGLETRKLYQESIL